MSAAFVKTMPTALVVGANFIECEQIARCLQPFYRILTAGSAGEAMAHVRQIRPAVVVLDPDLPDGDGILLKGKTLYVVRNDVDAVIVVELSPEFSSGEIVHVMNSPLFHQPTTIAVFGNALYVVNSHYETPPTMSTEYEVVRLPTQ